MALYLTEDDVTSLLPMDDALTAVESVLRAQAEGKAINESRRRVRAAGTTMHVMSGAVTGVDSANSWLGLKCYSVFGTIKFDNTPFDPSRDCGQYIQRGNARPAAMLRKSRYKAGIAATQCCPQVMGEQRSIKSEIVAHSHTSLGSSRPASGRRKNHATVASRISIATLITMPAVRGGRSRKSM